jgi:hypothetical protein
MIVISIIAAFREIISPSISVPQPSASFAISSTAPSVAK